jgi:hypothetical protein
MKRYVQLAALLAIVLLVSITAWAAFPGFTYDIWMDMEMCSNGSAPTAACLLNSQHGSGGGSWAVANTNSVLTAATSAQGTETGTTGSLGYLMSFTDPATQIDAIQKCFNTTCTFVTSHNSISLGFYYVTATCTGSFESDCIHTVIFDSNSVGPLTRISDEKDGASNNRVLRISPAAAGSTAAEVLVADATAYWVTIKYAFNGTTSQTTQLKVYTPTYTLPSVCSGQTTPCSAIYTTTSAGVEGAVTDIFFGPGTSSAAAQTTATTVKIDDIFFDWTNANFPLLPSGSVCTITLLGAGLC